MTVVTPLQSISVDLSVTNLLQVGLYGFLVVLYYYMYKSQKKQTEIQDRQTSIMESQNRLMAAEHQPELILDEEMGVDEDSVTVTLSNVGEGRARELSIQCYPFFKNKKGDWEPFAMDVFNFEISPVESPLTRVERTTRVPIAGKSEPANIGAHPDPSPLENGLEAKEESIRFKGEPKQEIKSRGLEMIVDFTGGVMRIIDEWDIDEIGLDIYVTYTDVVDNEHSTLITSQQGIKLERGMDLSDVLQRGEERERPILTYIPESAKEKIEKPV